MNPFCTDHPMTLSEPSALARRVQRWSLILIGAYGVYILLLGPLCALDGQGYLQFMPEPVKTVLALPAAPLVQVRALRLLLWDYLNWWYRDPDFGCNNPG